MAHTHHKPLSPEETLTEILDHLRRMDQRDRMRTWVGFIRGAIGLIPIVLVVLSLWYVGFHADELLKKIADTAASSAAQYTKGQGQSLFDRLMQ